MDRVFAAINHPVPQKTVRKRKKRIVLFVGGFLIILVLFFVFSIQIRQENGEKNIFTLLQPTPTPYAFQEMTIPYMREQDYKSNLGELTKVSEQAQYSSYLTSYTSEGLKINGLLTIPKMKEPVEGFPAIVFIHGYIPPTTYATLERYGDYINYLARNGFVVFKIDLRGHGNSEGTAGGGYFGRDYITDALNAYAALESADFVNPKGIGMWGHSMAGNILLRSVAVKPDIPAIVIWAGAVYSYTDRDKYGINDTSYRPPGAVARISSRRQELFQKHGSPSAQSVFWQEVIPTNYLSDLQGAIAIHHAVDDTVVNIGYSRDLIKLLDETKVPHELFEYPTGGHNITGASFGIAMERTTEFFKKYLVGE